MDEEVQTLATELLPEVQDLVEGIHGPFFSGANDGDYSVYRTLVVEAVLEFGTKDVHVHVGVVVDRHVDAVLGADSDQG